LFFCFFFFVFILFFYLAFEKTEKPFAIQLPTTSNSNDNDYIDEDGSINESDDGVLFSLFLDNLGNQQYRYWKLYFPKIGKWCRCLFIYEVCILNIVKYYELNIIFRV